MSHILYLLIFPQFHLHNQHRPLNYQKHNTYQCRKKRNLHTHPTPKVKFKYNKTIIPKHDRVFKKRLGV